MAGILSAADAMTLFLPSSSQQRLTCYDHNNELTFLQRVGKYDNQLGVVPLDIGCSWIIQFVGR